MKYDVIIIKKPEDIIVSFIAGNLNYTHASSSAVKTNKRCDVGFRCIFATTGSWITGREYPLE